MPIKTIRKQLECAGDVRLVEYVSSGDKNGSAKVVEVPFSRLSERGCLSLWSDDEQIKMNYGEGSIDKVEFLSTLIDMISRPLSRNESLMLSWSDPGYHLSTSGTDQDHVTLVYGPSERIGDRVEVTRASAISLSRIGLEIPGLSFRKKNLLTAVHLLDR